MKKITTTSAFVISSFISFSQNTNSYTAYIQQDTAIQWAAECDKVINLSPKINEYSLKKWYLDKLKNGPITVYKKNNGSSAISSYTLSLPGIEKQDWLQGFTVELSHTKYPNQWYFIDNSMPKNNYDRVKYRGGQLNLSADSCCGCDEADAFRAKQIINYKNGKFSICNVFISPLCARKTDKAPFDWYPLCNVACNDNAERKFPGLSKDVVLLNTDEVDYEFSPENPSPFDSVLTVYRTDIGSLIYQDVLKGNIKPFDIESGKLIPEKEFLTWKMPSDTVPAYNDNGEIAVNRYIVTMQERRPDEFSRLRIKQDLYFDFNNERLYSIIRSVIIMLPVRSPEGSIRGYMQYCKIY